MPPSKSPTEFPQSRRIRQTRRGIERSEGIICTASELFLEKGYEGSSMEEIIQRSGGSKSHIYREFGGKDGLFLASVKFLCDEVQVSIETVDVSALSVKGGLQKLALSLVQVLLTERHLALQRLVFAEAARFNKAGEIWFERGPQMTHRIFSRYFESCMKARLLRRADPMLAASLFCDMLSGHILDRAWLGIGRRPSRAEAKRTINAAIDVFLNGYGGPLKN
jgi:AcrR family transcriptional regulator